MTPRTSKDKKNDTLNFENGGCQEWGLSEIWLAIRPCRPSFGRLSMGHGISDQNHGKGRMWNMIGKVATLRGCWCWLWRKPWGLSLRPLQLGLPETTMMAAYGQVIFDDGGSMLREVQATVGNNGWASQELWLSDCELGDDEEGKEL